MRLLELEIHDIRGIRTLHLIPEGENLLIWGPNGSGKSAVVDAIDFLLTGRMSRLAGRGTAGISLSKHGPHIDSDPSKAIVRGVFRIAGLAEPVELRRCLAQPGTLESDGAVGRRIEPFLELAQRGQHVLTRREILKYITTEAGTRAQEIQHLLNITSVETVRKALVTVENKSDEAVQNANSALGDSKASVNVIAGLLQYSSDQVLAFVNQQRAELSGASINELKSDQLHKNLSPPISTPGSPAVNIGHVAGSLRVLESLLSDEGVRNAGQQDQDLRGTLEDLRADPGLMKALARRELIELGLKLVDETGTCPLCDAQWPPGDLRARLSGRLAAVNMPAQQIEKASRLAEDIRGRVSTCLEALRQLRGSAAALELQNSSSTLEAWIEQLENLSEHLKTPLQSYPKGDFATDRVSRLLAPPTAEEMVSLFKAGAAARSPGVSKEQAAWDILTRLGEALRSVERAQGRLDRAKLAHQRAITLITEFRQARDAILGQLYEQVQDRFVELYKQLHGSDESSFTAKLQPEGAGLDFRVDFYGRGVHPPQALHSEGHQDSMGICLYLALAERLTGGVIDLTILDDVMMSVDSDHRRELCHLLATAFPSRQLIITTHDRTWANQLRTEGVVRPKKSVQFYSWEISSGPRVLHEADLWKRIQEDLAASDLPAAALRLRRGSEEYFADVCDGLWAPVRFRLSSRLELGDLVPAASGRLKSLLRQAKKAANSWSNREAVEMLGEIESTASQILERAQVEQWAVNENVHYNSWANFTAADFGPVVEAFQDLFDLFRCSECGSLLRVTSIGPAPATVQCNCGRVNWNLRQAG